MYGGYGDEVVFYQEKELGDSSILVNDANNLNINGEDEALYLYKRMKLGVSPLKFSYIPTPNGAFGHGIFRRICKIKFLL